MQIKILFFKLLLSGALFTTMVMCLHKEYSIKRSDYRLSQHIVPVHYNIIINLDISRNYVGVCEIQFYVLKEMKHIRLHSENLKILEDEIILNDENKNLYKPSAIKYNTNTHILDLRFDQYLLPAHYYSIFIVYNYVSHYYNQQDVLFFTHISRKGYETKYEMLGTKIQSIEARQLFPCWDEPVFNSTFHINVMYRRDNNESYIFWPRLSPEKWNIENNSEWIRIDLNMSIPIPTYNLMFAITNLYLVANNYLFRTISSRINVASYMNFAQSVIQETTNSVWYNIIPDANTLIVDQIAIPAIQNDIIAKWKLIIYKESIVIYDEEVDSIAKKNEVARVVTRAMVQQSLNNIIRPSWWSHLWFTEGLTTFLYMKVLDEIFPEWRFPDLFVVQVQHECLRLDRHPYMKALIYDIITPSEIKSLFSFPVYIKAPVIFRMIENIVGRINIKMNVRKYLNKFKFSAIKPNNLWFLIDKTRNMLMDPTVESYGNTIHHILNDWAQKNGYPIVHTIREENQMLLAQDLYYVDDKGYYWSTNKKWWIPITFTAYPRLNFGKTAPMYWLGPNLNEIRILFNIANEWIIVNLQQAGYYRVRYDDKSFNHIVRYMNSATYKNIHVLNRAQLIDDTYYFWIQKEYTYDKFMHLMSYLSQETDYVAWYPMFKILQDLSRFLPYKESKPLKNQVRIVLKNLLTKISYINETSNESDLAKWLRLEALHWACLLEDSQCLQAANALLTQHLKNPIKQKLLPKWKEWAYCKGSITENPDVIERLEILASREFRIFNSLSCFKKSHFLRRLLFNKFFIYFSIKDPYFMPINIFVDHVTENMDEALKHFDSPRIALHDKKKLLCIVIDRLHSHKKLKKLKSYAKSLITGFLDRKNIINKIEKRLIQIQLQRQKIKYLIDGTFI